MDSKLSPMMQQYVQTKEEYPDCILFYRLGDFYEMFFEDAKLVSRELELTLTGKECGLEERAPMCGVPYHAVDMYLEKLVKLGYKVAIAEQVEDPKLAKGLVKREVIRVVTPGTILAAQAVDEKKNNYLMCIFYTGQDFGLSLADVTTGEYLLSEVKNKAELLDEIFRFQPAEIIANDSFLISGVDFDDIKMRLGFAVSTLDAKFFDDAACYQLLCKHFRVASVSSLGLSAYHSGVMAAGALLQYLYDTQKNDLRHMTSIVPYSNGKFMILDNSTRRNLELTQTLWNKEKRGSLLWVLDQTGTAMGARLLRSYVEQPLMDKKEILYRQNAIGELKDSVIDREELREYIAPIYDLERLIGRISYGSANPKDLIALKNSMQMLPAIRTAISHFKADAFVEATNRLDCLEDLYELIEKAIQDDPPLLVHDGGIIRDGYSEEVDTLRKAKYEGKDWLASLEAEEREKTGIKNLKIKFNKVFGYYFEVTNSFQHLVPEYFERKQTLVNAERYTMPKLKEMENVILGADEKLTNLEYQLFCEIRDRLAAQVARVQLSAHIVAMLDVYTSLAGVADKYGYVRPKINERGVLTIKNGRHPVVERVINDGQFVPNDVELNDQEGRVSIITGPNMAGKSTYMRQVALITLMAQMGSFVPASEANICICDRIFTRVGASDDLASGQSTFMVEMNEVSNILKHATRKSLIVLDEIGRGTSTYDGMAIAWAVVEYISDKKILGAKTLFATHYHELTELEGALEGVNNYCIAVKEQGDNVIFLRKIIKGGADKSYGIQVARLAGVPDKVLARAKELVEQLSAVDIAQSARDVVGGMAGREQPAADQGVDSRQMSLFDYERQREWEEKPPAGPLSERPVAEEILQEIMGLNPATLTPLDALTRIYQWKEKMQ